MNQAFENLPNFRARQVTSLFRSRTDPIKWIPDSVVAAEIAYEEDRESYSEVRVDGRAPAGAPAIADSDYMGSLDKAWSSGDYETISHCVFSELADSDFHRVRVEHSDQGDLAVFEFKGPPEAQCLGVLVQSQISYPSYKGLLKAKAETGELVHVEVDATGLPATFPLDRAERSVDYGMIRIGGEQYLLPSTGYWFGCFRGTYSCFLNRMDFRDYRLFRTDSVVRFSK